MWLRLIGGGFLAALGLSLFISVCVTPISPKCTRFYGTLAVALFIPGLVFFLKGFKGYLAWVKKFHQK